MRGQYEVIWPTTLWRVTGKVIFILVLKFLGLWLVNQVTWPHWQIKGQEKCEIYIDRYRNQLTAPPPRQSLGVAKTIFSGLGPKPPHPLCFWLLVMYLLIHLWAGAFQIGPFIYQLRLSLVIGGVLEGFQNLVIWHGFFLNFSLGWSCGWWNCTNRSNMGCWHGESSHGSHGLSQRQICEDN